MNIVNLSGKLGKNMSIVNRKNNYLVANFTVVIKNYDHSLNKTTVARIDCVAYNGIAQLVKQIKNKDKTILDIAGRFQIKKYQNKAGQLITEKQVIVENIKLRSSL